MTNVVLNVLVVAGLALVCVPVLRRRRPGTRIVPLLVTFAVLAVLTAVFDTIMIGIGLYTYDPAKILGVRVLDAPVEDFFYPLATVLVVPAVWTILERRRKDP